MCVCMCVYLDDMADGSEDEEDEEDVAAAAAELKGESERVSC